ncbi:hypothetical protein N7563_06685 [Leclercia adecarboxylata ATCC 23216 = NBRC 102595]|nr:hypothetical protein [Leclercia adecarboxylata ATCC 23216 = NBRC 102595]
MKRIIIGLILSGTAGVSNAVDILHCDYAKGVLSDASSLSLNPMGSGNVEFNGKSFKAVRPDGSYVITSPLTTSKPGMIFLDDKTKVFAASLDKSNFAVSDRIAKTTEQWANCKNISPISEKADSKDVAADWKYRPLTKAEISAIEFAVKEQLKDPESARFKHSRYVSNGKGAYCGLVNSKNSYGGYAGNTPFIVMLINNGKPHAGFIGMGGSDDENISTISVCRENGYFN